MNRSPLLSVICPWLCLALCLPLYLAVATQARAAEATAQATVNAVLFANGIHTVKGFLPAALELNP
jgi:hypothetical protein